MPGVRTLEEHARAAASQLRPEEQTDLVEFSRALDQVGRRNSSGEVSVDARTFREALKKKLPTPFVDRYVRMLQDMPGSVVKERPDGEPIPWPELAQHLSPQPNIPDEDTPAGLGITTSSTDDEVREKVKARYGTEVRDDIFDRRKLKDVLKKHSEEADRSSAAAARGAEAAAVAEEDSLMSRYMECLRDWWVPWFVICAAVWVFYADDFGTAIATVLAGFWLGVGTLAIVIGCFFWSVVG